MNTLFISTFDKLITIALFKDGKVCDKEEKESSMNHSIFVMPMIDNILKNNKLDTSNLNEIIVINGPGSFTGVRIGVTIAKTLAYTLSIPIKSITSLESFAVSTSSESNKLVSISDIKGKYVGYFNSNNELINDFVYMSNKDYEDFISDKKEYIVENKLDLNKIYDYLKEKESINPHLVNPIYVKGIEALNGK